MRRTGRILAVALLLLPGLVRAADIETITHGDRVDITTHLVPGKYTLFDFYADWCGPCRSLEPTLVRLASQHAQSLALRKVDVVDWNSEVGRQYGISSMPHLKLFGPDGAKIAEGDAGSVLNALEDGLGSGPGGAVKPPSKSVFPFFAFLVLVAVVAYFALFRGRRPQPVAAPGQRTLEFDDGGRPFREPSAPQAADAVWFVMIQGSLEGPFSRSELEDLRRRKCIARDAEVRRKGDREWRSLTELPPSE